jgi:hypothetical protein
MRQPLHIEFWRGCLKLRPFRGAAPEWPANVDTGRMRFGPPNSKLFICRVSQGPAYQGVWPE